MPEYTVALPKDLSDWLRREAAKEDKQPEDLVVIAVRHYLEKVYGPYLVPED